MFLYRPDEDNRFDLVSVHYPRATASHSQGNDAHPRTLTLQQPSDRVAGLFPDGGREEIPDWRQAECRRDEIGAGLVDIRVISDVAWN